MIKQSFQLNTGLNIAAKPWAAKRSYMHVTIITVVRASRPEGASF